MREFETIIDYISKGLRPRGRSRRNAEGLVECYNLRCGPRGLEPYTPLSNPISGVDLSPSWPFPQLITSTRYKFLVTRDEVGGQDRIYEVSNDYSTITLIALISHSTYGVGGRWSIADFDEYVLLSNGVYVVYRDTTVDTFDSTTALTSTPTCNSICNFKGQLVGGGVRSSWYDCDSSYIVWSRIGDVDCTIENNNEAGIFRVPFEGEVYQVRRLGDFVVVYCENGILALSPVTSPAPTFKFIELSGVGLHSRYSVGGDYNVHLFVDAEGYVYGLDRNLRLNKLDYQEFMLEMGDYIVVNYNPYDNDFYIGDGSKGYLINENGMSEIGQSILDFAEPGAGLFVDLGDDEARITTDLIDMGYRGQKSTEVIEAGFTNSGIVRASIDWRIDNSNDLENTGWVEVNNQGVATIRVVGTEFRLRLKSSDYSDFELDYLKLRYKMSDLRSIRGIYAPPPRGQ